MTDATTDATTEATDDAVRRDAPAAQDPLSPLDPDMFDPVCPSSVMPFRVGDWGHRPRP